MKGQWIALRSSLCLAVAVIVFAGVSGCNNPAPGGDEAAEGDAADMSRDRARIVAEQVMDAMGGRENWNATRYLRFSFFGFRTHYWDKATGRYRLSWTDRESGQSHVILMNLNTLEGSVYTDGSEITDVETRDGFLERGRRAWINDTYWMLMPYKLQDPGVNLVYEDEEVIDDTVYDKLHLSFEDVGVTPGDEYWAYINRETHLMDKWVFLLQLRDGQEERSRGEWKWNGWRKYGGIMLSAEREGMDGQKRSHADVAVFDHVDDSVFTSSSPVNQEMLRETAGSDASDASETSATSQPAERSE